PSTSEISAGWESQCAELEKFSQENGGKKFLFTEIGYNESSRAAAEPWGFQTGGEHCAEIQQRCIEAALELGARHSFLAGMYWWKWFPELPHQDRKSTRLNSSHLGISYAVFCLKKKKKEVLQCKSTENRDMLGATTQAI